MMNREKFVEILTDIILIGDIHGNVLNITDEGDGHFVVACNDGTEWNVNVTSV